MHTVAKPRIYRDSRAFSCKAGVATGKKPCHPLFLLRIYKLTAVCSRIPSVPGSVVWELDPAINVSG